MPTNQRIAKVAKRVALAIIVYVLGWLATTLVFGLSNESGLEGDPNAEIPFYAVFTVLYGAVLGWWWLLSFPVLQFYVFEPLWNEIQYGGPIHYAYDRPGFVIAGTLGIAAGVLLRFLYQRARGEPSEPSASRARR